MTQKPIRIGPFTIALTVVIGLELLFHRFFGNRAAALWQQLGMMAGLRLLQAVAVWMGLNSDGAGADRVGLKPALLRRGAWHGVLWTTGFGLCVVVGAMFAWIKNWPAENLIKTPLPQTFLDLFLFLGVGGIVGPIAEELVFRSLIYGFFRRWGVSMALIISTLFFVAAHGSGTFWLVPLVGGIVFALSYERSHSLVTPIIIHVAGNLTIFSASWLFF